MGGVVEGVSAGVSFIECGLLDIRMWNGDRARHACLSRGQLSWLDGFTVSDFDLGKMINNAPVDQARKYRRRTPAETSQIRASRKTG
jgi:hypothetical protein